MRKYLNISILIDNPNSWFHEYRGALSAVLKKYDPYFSYFTEARQLKKGGILFLLSCDRLLPPKMLLLHEHNIVIHESDLPKGRGWSSLTWQVEKGKNKIPITLFEADEKCDAGDYYIKDTVVLDGTELVEEIRQKQVQKTIEMIDTYLRLYPMKPKPQKGKAQYFRKRVARDNELNINRSIKSQLNKIRVADNKRYPLYFRFKGKKFILRISRQEENL